MAFADKTASFQVMRQGDGSKIVAFPMIDGSEVLIPLIEYNGAWWAIDFVEDEIHRIGGKDRAIEGGVFLCGGKFIERDGAEFWEPDGKKIPYPTNI